MYRTSHEGDTNGEPLCRSRSRKSSSSSASPPHGLGWPVQQYRMQNRLLFRSERVSTRRNPSSTQIGLIEVHCLRFGSPRYSTHRSCARMRPCNLMHPLPDARCLIVRDQLRMKTVALSSSDLNDPVGKCAIWNRLVSSTSTQVKRTHLPDLPIALGPYRVGISFAFHNCETRPNKIRRHNGTGNREPQCCDDPPLENGD